MLGSGLRREDDGGWGECVHTSPSAESFPPLSFVTGSDQKTFVIEKSETSLLAVP
jgi:hypothetical protein